jgi:hypothetical protein
MQQNAQVADPFVASVLQKFRDRSVRGLAKYGTTLARSDLKPIDWLVHLQVNCLSLHTESNGVPLIAETSKEELMDAVLYLERFKEELMDAVLYLERFKEEVKDVA